jgi:uncharacterized RDD family membrane protein YckC
LTELHGVDRLREFVEPVGYEFGDDVPVRELRLAVGRVGQRERHAAVDGVARWVRKGNPVSSSRDVACSESGNAMRVGATTEVRGAGPWVRALALAVDELVRWIVIYAVTTALLASGRFGVDVFAATVFATYALYGGLLEGLTNGQTLGKRALRIRVVRRDGARIGIGAALLRNVLLLVDALPAAYLLGLFVLMSTRDFRRLGDLAAGTVVVYADDVVEPWHEADRGSEAVRANAAAFYGSWLAAAVPVFVVVAIALWDSPSLAGIALWWFKPFYERWPMWMCAQRARGEPANVALAFAQWRSLVRGLGSMLTYRRLIPRRSFDAPIEALEGLRGAQRRGRAVLLHRRDAQPAAWATIVGVHVEAFVSTVAGFALWYAVPTTRFDVDSLLAIASEPWFGWASNLIYLGAIGLVGPHYAAAGYMLYRHRCDALERGRA